MTDQSNPNEATQAMPKWIALIERSLLVLLVIGLFVGVLAVVKPSQPLSCLVPRSRPLLGRCVRALSVAVETGTTATILLSSLALIGFPVLAVAPPLPSS